MQASLAFLNGATHAGSPELPLLNALLANKSPGSAAIDSGPSKDQEQAEEESQEPSVSRPGAFKNDPDDPTNPNEVRERYLDKVDQVKPQGQIKP